MRARKQKILRYLGFGLFLSITSFKAFAQITDLPVGTPTLTVNGGNLAFVSVTVAAPIGGNNITTFSNQNLNPFDGGNFNNGIDPVYQWTDPIQNNTAGEDSLIPTRALNVGGTSGNDAAPYPNELGDNIASLEEFWGYNGGNGPAGTSNNVHHFMMGTGTNNYTLNLYFAKQNGQDAYVLVSPTAVPVVDLAVILVNSTGASPGFTLSGITSKRNQPVTTTNSVQIVDGHPFDNTSFVPEFLDIGPSSLNLNAVGLQFSTESTAQGQKLYGVQITTTGGGLPSSIVAILAKPGFSTALPATSGTATTAQTGGDVNIQSVTLTAQNGTPVTFDASQLNSFTGGNATIIVNSITYNFGWTDIISIPGVTPVFATNVGGSGNDATSLPYGSAGFTLQQIFGQTTNPLSLLAAEFPAGSSVTVNLYYGNGVTYVLGTNAIDYKAIMATPTSSSPSVPTSTTTIVSIITPQGQPVITAGSWAVSSGTVFGPQFSTSQLPTSTSTLSVSGASANPSDSGTVTHGTQLSILTGGQDGNSLCATM